MIFSKLLLCQTAFAIFGIRDHLAYEHQEDMLKMLAYLHSESLEREDALTEQANEQLAAFAEEMKSTMLAFAEKSGELMQDLTAAEIKSMVAQENVAFTEAMTEILAQTILIENAAIIEETLNSYQATFTKAMADLHQHYSDMYMEMDLQTQKAVMQEYNKIQAQITQLEAEGMSKIEAQQKIYAQIYVRLMAFMETARTDHQEIYDQYINDFYMENMRKFEAALTHLLEQKEAVRQMFQAEMEEQKADAVAYAKALAERELAQQEHQDAIRADQMKLLDSYMENQKEVRQESNAASQDAMDSMMSYQSERLQAERDLKMKQIELDAQIQQQEMELQKSMAKIEVVGKSPAAVSVLVPQQPQQLSMDFQTPAPYTATSSAFGRVAMSVVVSLVFLF